MSDQELIAKQEHVWDSIATLCTPFTEREWKTPTDCPGWSVQDQVAHIIGTESWLLGQPVPDHPPQDMRHVKNELGQWSRQGKPETLGLGASPGNWSLLPSG